MAWSPSSKVWNFYEFSRFSTNFYGFSFENLILTNEKLQKLYGICCCEAAGNAVPGLRGVSLLGKMEAPHPPQASASAKIFLLNI